MKKALALVLALVLALSMAVSAFAIELKDLTDLTPADPKKVVITVVDADDREVLYVDEAGTYYIALTDEEWYDVKVSSTGNVDAKRKEFDPETMEIVGNLNPVWSITEKGEVLEDAQYNNLGYEEAKDVAEGLNDLYEVTYYGIKLMTNVNVIEITIEDNFGVHYTTGDIKINALKKVDGVETKFGGVIEVVNDVVIFEYEEVKHAAANSDDTALEFGQAGYSDYFAESYGYDTDDTDYEVEENRKDEGAAVVSTTAFRAIEGKDLVIEATEWMNVTLKDIVKGQRAVNFYAYSYFNYRDLDLDGKCDNGELKSIELGFKGDQEIKGEFVIDVKLDVDYFELRELFGRRLEEDDVVIYYVEDANGKTVKEIEVNYMTADLTETVEFTIEGEGEKLGQYSIVLEPAAGEVAGEENPNTGAESVVGVVAALAVVSVATAAAVSLKK